MYAFVNVNLNTLARQESAKIIPNYRTRAEAKPYLLQFHIVSQCSAPPRYIFPMTVPKFGK